ncbi:MAG: hypothetical protein ABIK83_06235 [Candidatus Zixiibacteriota bacterium]
MGRTIQTERPHELSGHFKPRFYIWAGEILKKGLEPLVVGWAGDNYTVLQPDQNFLMTFGLIPRIVENEEEKHVHWDDLGRVVYDVVRVEEKSKYYYERLSSATVSIKKTYLSEYATLRDRTLIQTFSEIRIESLTSDVAEILGDRPGCKIRLPGRAFYISKVSNSEDQVYIQVDGARLLLKAGRMPVTEADEDCGELDWPGIARHVTANDAKNMLSESVFVRDTALNDYEQHPDTYQILPELGAVYYDGQWGVDRCYRVGRDFICIELRKLYEDAPPSVVRHWNSHAVDPPPGNPQQLCEEMNVALRSKRIVFKLAALGGMIARLEDTAFGSSRLPEDFVSLNEAQLQYSGWWKAPWVAPVTFHIPAELSESGYLQRCVDLRELIIEGLQPNVLRQLLTRLNVPESTIRELKSLGLLNILLQECIVAEETGLNIVKDMEQIEKRRLEKEAECKKGVHPPSPVGILFILNGLRTAGSHRDEVTASTLRKLRTNRASLISGWGYQLDKLYDDIGDALDEARIVILNAIP